MPDRWAVANGNWSSPATWNDGTLPTSGDDVFANNQTVTIDQDVSVLSLRTTARSGGVSGGGFSVSGTRSITGNIIGGTSVCVTHLSGSTSIITGNVFAGNPTNGMTVSNNSSCTIYGNVTSSSSGGINGVNCLSGGTLVIHGNIISTTSIGVANSGSLTVFGNVTGGTSGGSHGISSGGSLIINGDITGNAGQGLSLFGGTSNITGRLLANSSVQITGGNHLISLLHDLYGIGSSPVIFMSNGSCRILGNNIYGHSSANIQCITISGGYCKITANIYGGSFGTTSAVGTISNGRLFVVGNVYSGVSSAIRPDSFSGAVIEGNIVASGSASAVVCGNVNSDAKCFVNGNVTGGSTGHGILNNTPIDWYIFGEVTNGAALAVNNTSSGVITVVSPIGPNTGPRLRNIGGKVLIK